MINICTKFNVLSFIPFKDRMGSQNLNKNSSGDETANVNFFYYDNIAHAEASAYAHWMTS